MLKNESGLLSVFFVCLRLSDRLGDGSFVPARVFRGMDQSRFFDRACVADVWIWAVFAVFTGFVGRKFFFREFADRPDLIDYFNDGLLNVVGVCGGAYFYQKDENAALGLFERKVEFSGNYLFQIFFAVGGFVRGIFVFYSSVYRKYFEMVLGASVVFIFSWDVLRDFFDRSLQFFPVGFENQSFCRGKRHSDSVRGIKDKYPQYGKGTERKIPVFVCFFIQSSVDGAFEKIFEFDSGVRVG